MDHVQHPIFLASMLIEQQIKERYFSLFIILRIADRTKIYTGYSGNSQQGGGLTRFVCHALDRAFSTVLGDILTPFDGDDTILRLSLCEMECRS